MMRNKEKIATDWDMIKLIFKLFLNLLLSPGWIIILLLFETCPSGIGMFCISEIVDLIVMILVYALILILPPRIKEPEYRDVYLKIMKLESLLAAGYFMLVTMKVIID